MTEILGCVDELISRLDQSLPPRRKLDWSDVEVIMGVRLPTDYKQLIELLPVGEFRGLVRLLYPTVESNRVVSVLGEFENSLDDMRGWREDGDGVFPYPIYPEPGGLLPWGHSPRREPFFWITASDDPDTWTVAYADDYFTEWRTFAGRVCDFLLALVDGQVAGDLHGVEVQSKSPFISKNSLQGGLSVPSMPVAGRAKLTSKLDDLSALLPTKLIGFRQVDWSHTTRRLGVGLPSDYRAFIETYGPGLFRKIQIFGSHNVGTFVDPRDTRPGVVPPSHSLDASAFGRTFICWGTSNDGWIFGWESVGPDPDSWSVVFGNREQMIVELVGVSFSAFLLMLASNDPSIQDVLQWPATDLYVPE